MGEVNATTSWFPFQADAFRGHGLSRFPCSCARLVAKKIFATLSPGSSARAVPAGVAAFHFNQLESLSKLNFLYLNTKHVRFPVELKSTKTIIQEGTHLSYSNCIKSLLDIQDVNINVDENGVKEGTYKGKRCKYIS